jgi:hypothetical protein
MLVSILARSKQKRIRPKLGRIEEKTMWLSPTPGTIEAKRTKLVQNFARSKQNEQNCPKLHRIESRTNKMYVVAEQTELEYIYIWNFLEFVKEWVPYLAEMT